MRSMRTGKYLAPLFLLAILIFPFHEISHSQDNDSRETLEKKGPPGIVFLYDGPDRFYEESIDLIKKELVGLRGGKAPVRFMGTEHGDWDPDIIKQKLEALLADDDVDVIIGAGYFTGIIASRMELPKPVIIADFFDIQIMSVPYKDETSGKSNFTYLATPHLVRDQIDAFRRIKPFQKVHIFIDSVFLAEAKKIVREIKAHDFEIEFIGYRENLSGALAAIEDMEIEAVYLVPSSFLPEEDYDNLIDALNERKIPTFSAMGYVDVEKGVLAGLMPKILTKFARRVAINTDRVLKGENAGDINVMFVIENRFIVNARTAREIDISLPFDVLLSAEILYAHEGWGEELSIYEAVDEATSNYLLFRIRDEEIEQARQEHYIQWSQYLPTVKYSLLYDIYDTETAKLSLGLTPKRYLKNRFSLSQLIFSDPVFTEIINSKREVDITKLQKESSTLDITDETTLAYLEYLRTKALLKVETENLEANRHHLSMAKKRYDIGVAGREEQLRWGSEVAQSQSDVLKAHSNVQQARITLNELMNRPQETPFTEQDVGLETLGYYLGAGYLDRFVKNRETLLVFLDYMVQKAFENSPELRALDIAIRQQKLVKDTAMRKFFLPEAGLDGYIDHRLGKKHYGPIPENDHDDWYVQMKLSYPIFEGGSRAFDYEKQKSELDRLTFKKQLQQNQVELDVRRTTYRMGHSYPNIDLSRTAMENASENYGIVQTKYAKGTASITDLIDAQKDKFAREGDAVIAVYDLLADVYNFDRAVSKYYSLASEEEQKKWLEELKEYLVAEGIETR